MEKGKLPRGGKKKGADPTEGQNREVKVEVSEAETDAPDDVTEVGDRSGR